MGLKLCRIIKWHIYKVYHSLITCHVMLAESQPYHLKISAHSNVVNTIAVLCLQKLEADNNKYCRLQLLYRFNNHFINRKIVHLTDVYFN